MRHCGSSVLAFGLILAVVPRELAACQMCVAAQVDYHFPPWMSWFVLGFAWNFGQSYISAKRGVKTPYQSRIAGFLTLTAIVLVLGAIIMGPLLGLLFFVGPAVAFVRALVPRTWRKDRIARRWTLGLGAAMLILLTAAAVYSYHRASQMTRVDYALKWTGTVLDRTIYNEMRQEGATALPELHEVLERGDDYSAWFAARSIAAIDPEEDQMPMLLAAFRRLHAEEQRKGGEEGEAYSTLGMFEHEMRQYSGLDMPEESTPDRWEAAWRENP